MIRPPPTAPLFPYTTLFRSASGRPAPSRPRGGARTQGAGTRRRTAVRRDRRVARGVQYGDDGAQRGVDRKSTRLNSSHVSISYAVFCLKKKINSTLATTTRL